MAVDAVKNQTTGRQDFVPPAGGGKLFFRPRLSVPVVLAGLLVAALVGSLFIGRFTITPADLAGILFGNLLSVKTASPAALSTVILQIRLPRILAAVLVGAALSAAGAAYQGMFKNPLVSPDILGASAGAGFGAALAIYFSWGFAGIQLAAFCFGLLAVFLAYKLSTLIRYDPLLILVLSGILIGTSFSACISLIKYLADPYDKLPAITFWLMGSLASVSLKDVMALFPLIVIGFIPLYFARWHMNALTLSDEEAQSLGLNTKRMRVMVIACSTMMTAAAVSICGMIAWIGLVIPHMARLLVGHDYCKLLPTSLLLGGVFLLLVDDLARIAGSIEIPLGVLTSLLGAPFLVYLLIRFRRGWA